MFPKMLIDKNKSEYTVESIMLQKNDSIVGQLNAVYAELINIHSDRKLKRGRAFKDRGVKTLFARMDQMLTTRFGIKFKTVESAARYIGVATTPPKFFNTLAGDVSRDFKRTTEMLTELAPDTKGQRVDPDDIDTTMNGWKQSVLLTLQSITAVDKKLQVSDITVDLKVAKVYGYPSDSATVLHINPFTLVSTAALTAEEMTAATLHEVGHAFTHLEYAHRTVKTLTMLMEGVLDGIKSNKKPIDAIKLGYYSAFEDDGIKDTKSVVSASIGIASKYITQHKDYGDNSYANKEGERLADYFAAQFGVGVPLVSALKKLNEHTDGKHSDVSFSKTVVMVTVLLFAVNALLFAFAPAIGMISLFAMAAIVGIIVPLLITGFVIYVLINSLGALFGRGIDNYNPYDHLERRIKRIKNALVRQLKNGDVTKDDAKGIIAAIETIDIAGANIESYDENLIYRVVGKMFDYSGDQNELRDFDNLVDDMLHNNLFVATKKLEIANAEV